MPFLCATHATSTSEILSSPIPPGFYILTPFINVNLINTVLTYIGNKYFDTIIYITPIINIPHDTEFIK